MTQQSPELTVLAAMREARRVFHDRVVAHAADNVAHSGASPPPSTREDPQPGLTREHLTLLRSDGVAQIAEFYFAVAELGLNDGKRFPAYIKNHNRSMAEYLESRERRETLGLSPQRLRSARFGEQQIAFIREMSPPGRLFLDQSSLGRLLIETMSPETCRKLVVALADGGLLRRSRVGPVVVWSDGTLEGLYREHLARIVDALGRRSGCAA